MTTVSTSTPPVEIPWPCLLSHPFKPLSPPKTSSPTQQKTFAQALNNVCDIPLSQFPKPCVKGDRWSIAIPEEEYLAGVDACKHNIHGRIFWPKGVTPLSLDSLRSKLAVVWKAIGKWGIISLGKGYYEFSFSSLEDMRSVRSVSSWNLAPGMLKLFAWNPDFNPSLQQQSSAQVWIRIHGLSQEYWRPKILFAIASSVGTPICLDAFSNKHMLERSFGHYARVLVDVNLLQELRFGVLVERKGFAFFVDIEYENLPDFCSYCSSIGHHVDVCKKKREPVSKGPAKKQFSEPVKNYVPIKHKEQVMIAESVEVVVPPPYTQMNHEQLRREADRILEQELNNNNNTVLIVDDSPKSPTPLSTPIPQPIPIAEPILMLVEDTPHNVSSQNPTPQVSHPPSLEVVSTNEDEKSSDNSEFIDATQVMDVIPDAVTVPLVPNMAQEEVCPVIVQHEINFLKESWVNLADQEDAALHSSPHSPITDADSILGKPPDINDFAEASVPCQDDNDGFKLVTSRSSKRVEKQRLSQKKKTTITSSKVGSNKPFK
ncbi:hypothetical protein QL285_003121 [Trifolium repens]|nr:hypothetical protein QL285_003121 [Trifolium repens]